MLWQRDAGTAPDGVGAGMLLIGVRLAAGGFPRSLCSCFGSRHLRQLAQGLLVLGRQGSMLCQQRRQLHAGDLFLLTAAPVMVRLSLGLHEGRM